MTEPEVLPHSQVVRLIAQADKREFALFLGAGASFSSGVPLASMMIKEWRQTIFEERAPAGKTLDEWCQAQPWYGKDDEYSLLFETLFPNERARQKYVEPKIEAGFPAWGYLYLANIIVGGHFNVIFTTNFDDLINDALTIYLGYNPVVCAADSEVLSINISTDRAKIIKLHGDYLFKRLKNTVADLAQLDPNMQSKFKEFAKQCGLIVVGYAGRDRSVMRVLAELLKDDTTFPTGIYWGIRPGDQPAALVKELADAYPTRFRLFTCPDFDMFMVRLHSALKLDLPQTIVQPYESLHATFARLVAKTSGSPMDDPTIQAHIQQLQQQLDRPWAQTTDVSDFDLLQAQLALGRRDYKPALTLVTKYAQQKPNDANGLTTWGNALALKAQEERSDAAWQEAASKWKDAVRLDPQSLPPRYSLAQYYMQAHQTAEAIAECEALYKLVPNDAGLCRNLVALYAAGGRLDDARKEVESLLAREPNAADLYAIKASVLEQRGLVMDALDALRHAVSLQADNAWLHFSLANSLARIGHGDEAAAEYEQAIQLDPHNLSYRLQVTNFYWTRQQPTLAQPHLEAAVAIEPNSAEARGWLSQIYMAQRRFPEAQRELEAVLKLTPQDTRALINAGYFYVYINRADLAERYLRDATTYNPRHPQPYMMLCWLYWASNRMAEFNATMQTLMQIAPPAAQWLQQQLKWAQTQFMGNRQAALQAQWTSWLQAAPPPQQTSSPQGSSQGQQSAPDWLRWLAGR